MNKINESNNLNLQNEIVLNVIEVEQKGNIFYIGKIKARDLIKIATVHVRGSISDEENKYLNEVKDKLSDTVSIQDSDFGIQRVMQLKRLREISEYLKDSDFEGILPGSLIVSINNKINWESDDRERLFSDEGFTIDQTKCAGVKQLSIKSNMVDAFIVDGQHRLGSFEYAKELIDQFELVVTIFLDMQIPLQAEVFGVINGKQKPVNKSLLYDLKEFGKNNYEDIKRCHTIAKWFNQEEKSPLKNKIKMLGTGYGSISQSAFIDELQKYVKKRKPAFAYKSFLRERENVEIIRILHSYFISVRHVFEGAWDNTENYVLLRTTGFGALMKALYYIYIFHYVNGLEFKKVNLVPFLAKIKKVTDFSVMSEGKSAGQGLQLTLSKRILKELIGDEKTLRELEKKYKDIVM